jgi:hypothetical protein
MWTMIIINANMVAYDIFLIIGYMLCNGGLAQSNNLLGFY